MINLKGWDGWQDTANDHSEVITKVRAYLRQWMQQGDDIMYIRDRKTDGRVLAYVCNDVCEPTDAHVAIQAEP